MVSAELRARRKQAPGVGVRHGRKHGSGRATFHHTAAVHHQHARHVLCNHTQVVGDQHQGHATLCHQALDQRQDLLLHRHVQRGGGLVCDQQVGATGQCHGNGDALALPAGELVRVLVHAPRCIGNTHPVQQGQCLGACSSGGQTQVQAQGLCHLAANAVHRVQRRHRLLEHHANTFAADAAESSVALAPHFFTVEPDAATDLGAVRQQAQQGHGGEGLATTRLTHQPQCFAPGQCEVDTPHRVGGATGCLQTDMQVADG